MVFLPGEVVQNVQHLVPGHGIQAPGGLVQNQQPCPVGQRHRDGQLHAHAPGVVLEGLPLRQVKARKIRPVQRSVPVRVAALHHLSNIGGSKQLREVGLVQHHADVLLGPDEAGIHRVGSQHPHLAIVPADRVHQQVDDRALARAVFAHQPQHAAAGQREIHVLQRKARIALAQIANLNRIFHLHFPPPLHAAFPQAR